MVRPKDNPEHAVNIALAKSATVELITHYAVLGLVLMPVLAILFPAMLLAISATMLASIAPEAALAYWLQTGRYGPFTLSCVIAAGVGTASVWLTRRLLSAFPPGLRALAGEKGLNLSEMVAAMWQQLAPGREPPCIRWFPALDIAAYAVSRDEQPELLVSAGLWRAATSDDPIATAIIAHELSHLRYRDPRSLAWLDIIVASTRGILLVTALFSAIIVFIVLAQETLQALYAGKGLLEILYVWIRIVSAASVVLVLIPLGWLALRRQVAFVMSLIEIRADVAGAQWTRGLQEFTQVFATHESVVKTSDRDLFAAIISPSFSHIPQRERLSILGNPALLVTPKLEFFALSILLVFLLPINFATPYLMGGALNYMVIQVLAAALNTAVVAMLIVGSTHGAIPLPSQRLFTLAIASCVVTALPRINLEPLSYLPFSWLVEFGGEGANWSSLPHDIAITFKDVAEKAQNGLFNLGAVAAVLIGYASLAVLSRTVAKGSMVCMRLAIACTISISASFFAGFDPYRADDLPWGEALEAFTTNAPALHGLMLALPLLAVAVIETVFYTSRRIGSSVKKMCHLLRPT